MNGVPGSGRSTSPDPMHGELGVLLDDGERSNVTSLASGTDNSGPTRMLLMALLLTRTGSVSG